MGVFIQFKILINIYTNSQLFQGFFMVFPEDSSVLLTFNKMLLLILWDFQLTIILFSYKF